MISINVKLNIKQFTQHFGKLKGDRAVLNLGNTFKAFLGIMEGIKDFHLTIREIF